MAIISGAECDACGRVSYFHEHSHKGDMIDYYRRAGWSITKKTGEIERANCPDCKKNRKKASNNEN